MNIRSIFGVAIGIATLTGLLSACGNNAPAPAAPAPVTARPASPMTGSPAPASVAAAPTTSEISADTYRKKSVGQAWGTLDPSTGETRITAWLTKITVDPPCDRPGTRKPGMHTLVLDFTVQMPAAGGDPSDIQAFGNDVLNETRFSTRGADGITNQAEYNSPCKWQVKKLPFQFAPSSKYTGQLVIDTPDPHGTLLLTAGNGFLNGSMGWEWDY
ncbi:hypothetical protein [Amycolatopsis orientalis]|uniref:hypothetical protein n=1 Tax=Amycolatopsis orientalis TaxID=31958 RepID=UPI0003A0F7D3|nr:hypothetical protein [Amycolatopsis orientalis]